MNIIRAEEHGILPGGEKSVAKQICALIHAAPENSIIEFQKGEYHLCADDCVQENYHITNTASEKEMPCIQKNIGIYIHRKKNLTLRFNGALFLVFGEMTPVLIDASCNIEIQELFVDYARATMHELHVVSADARSFTAKVNPDCPFEVKDGRLNWLGGHFYGRADETQVCDLKEGKTWRTFNYVRDCKAEQLDGGHVRFTFGVIHQARKHEIRPGIILQTRYHLRSQAGVFITESADIRFFKCKFHYMHGLGIVGQCAENLYFEDLECAPRKKTGRTAAGFADFMHFSSCRGKITVKDSYFSGAHDDVINVHGFHLQVVDIPQTNQIVVRFMHEQAYGYQIFRAEDQIEFVQPRSLTPLANAVVKHARMLNPRDIELTLSEDVEDKIKPGLAVENISATPEVWIKDNYFTLIPTRGILVTTRKKVVIEDNIFDKMGMAGVLISDDARTWYESGCVRDVTICNNKFIGCGHASRFEQQAAVMIRPENKVRKGIIHKNIRIFGNDFIQDGYPVLYAKCTSDLTFQDNTLEGDLKKAPALHFVCCKKIRVAQNRIRFAGGFKIKRVQTPKKECDFHE